MVSPVPMQRLNDPAMMSFCFRWPFRWSKGAIALPLALIMIGCSNDRTAQCSRLTQVTNKTVGEVQTIVSTSSQPNAEALRTVAASFDQGRQEMEALALSDEQLQVFQQGFIELYRDVSDSAQSLADALSEQDFSRAQEARSAFQAVTEREAPLVEDVNEYCGAIASP